MIKALLFFETSETTYLPTT